MGAWMYMGPRLRDLIEDRLPVRYIGRPDQASPAEGHAELHQSAQRAIIEAAFAGELKPDDSTAREEKVPANGTATNGKSAEEAPAAEGKKKVTASSAD